MERVNKGEKYWMVLVWWSHVYVDEVVDLHCISDEDNWNQGNYFNTKEEAEVMAEKLRAVLKGADVIEMPSEEELDKKLDECGTVIGKRDWDTQRAFLFAVEWLKSKIVK